MDVVTEVEAEALTETEEEEDGSTTGAMIVAGDLAGTDTGHPYAPGIDLR